MVLVCRRTVFAGSDRSVVCRGECVAIRTQSNISMDRASLAIDLRWNEIMMSYIISGNRRKIFGEVRKILFRIPVHNQLICALLFQCLRRCLVTSLPLTSVLDLIATLCVRISVDEVPSNPHIRISEALTC